MILLKLTASGQWSCQTPYSNVRQAVQNMPDWMAETPGEPTIYALVRPPVTGRRRLERPAEVVEMVGYEDLVWRLEATLALLNQECLYVQLTEEELIWYLSRKVSALGEPLPGERAVHDAKL